MGRPRTRPRSTSQIGIKLPRLKPEEEADLVFCATAIGFDQHRIAKMLGISLNRLQNEYQEVLDTGADRANCAVGGTLYNIATDLNHPSCASAGMFWTKTRLGWRDVAPNGDKKDIMYRIIGGLPDPKEVTASIVEHVINGEIDNAE